MDFTIRRQVSELNSTCFIEIGPGPYAGEHWQEGFIFVAEDAFGTAEGLLQRHLPDYSHFAPNELPYPIGCAVLAEWRDAAARLAGLTGDEVYAALRLDDSYRRWSVEEVALHRDEIAALLRQLAVECERFYRTSETLCILGL